MLETVESLVGMGEDLPDRRKLLSDARWNHHRHLRDVLLANRHSSGAVLSEIKLTLAKDCYSGRIAPELVNMLLYPLQRKSLIIKTCIGSPIRLKRRSRQPAKCSKPVVHSDVLIPLPSKHQPQE